ncbi:MAG: hypothetical protein RMJ32_03990 [Aquificaceae bacterium]|nr:hypothetical protein [Aquificaceae bacterium]
MLGNRGVYLDALLGKLLLYELDEGFLVESAIRELWDVYRAKLAEVFFRVNKVKMEKYCT